MIYNRTENDIETARNLIETKVKNFGELTVDEVAKIERGTFTINTLNRIEQKQAELKTLFNDIGYWNTPIINRTWAEYDIFGELDFQRVLDNTNTLREAFFVYNNTPITPPISYHYNDINALEKILYDLENMVNDMKTRYRQCGTFECGEE